MCVGNRFLVITFNRLPVYYSWTVVTIIVGIDNANGTSASLTGQMLSEKQIQASINRHGRSSRQLHCRFFVPIKIYNLSISISDLA
jgi:hypothetical protein